MKRVIYLAPKQAIFPVQALALTYQGSPGRLDAFLQSLSAADAGWFEFTDTPGIDDGINFLVPGGTGVGSFGPGYKRATSAASVPAITQAASPVKIMLCGDSITAGGDSLYSDGAVAWRASFWELIREARGKIKLLGSTLNGLWDNRAAAPSANPPGNVTLGDWHSAATGGNNLAQIAAQTAADEVTYGLADVYVLLGGENNIKAGVLALQSAAAIAATVLAGIDTWIAARISANPLAQLFVLDLTPHGTALANYAQYDAAVALVNAALPAHLAALGHSNLHFVAAGSLLTKAHVSAVDGEHPNTGGFRLIAGAVAERIYASLGPCVASHPRKVSQVIPVARLSTVNDYPSSAYITETGTALCPVGTESVSFGITWVPNADLGESDSVFTRMLVGIGPVGNYDLFLRTNKSYAGTTFANCLELYIAGVARFVQNDCVRHNTPMKIGIAFDNVKHEAIIFALRAGPDGKPITACVSAFPAVPALTWAGSPEIRLGGQGVGGLAYSTTGIKGDFWIARGKVIDINDMENWYYDNALPSGVTAYYPLNDGAGTAIAPGGGFGALLPTGTCTNGWSAAGAVREPWHRYADSQNKGTFVLNGASAVVIPCYGMRAGDESGISAVMTTVGGTVGKTPTIVAGTDEFTVNGTASDISTYAWRWRP